MEGVMNNRQRSGGPEAPTNRCQLFGPIVRIGRQNHQSTIDWERFELDAESETFLVRESSPNFCPALSLFSVAFVSSTVELLSWLFIREAPTGEGTP
jgi:hypothetical protein